MILSARTCRAITAAAALALCGGLPATAQTGACIPVGKRSQMSVPRDAHTMIRTRRAGAVLLLGGRVSPEGTTTAICDWFDEHTGRFTPAAPMISSRSFVPAIGLSDGRVLVIGGYKQEKDGGTIRGCEIYTPARNQWSRAAPMGVSRELHTATLLPNGRILAAGGFSNNRLLSSAELYDPATDRWTAAAPMAQVRFGHTATLLTRGPNAGKLLLIGGRGENDASRRSTELYDYRTNRCSPGPDLAEPRFRHTATLLQDGRILIAGGYNHDPGVRGCLDTAEIYDPWTNSFTSVGNGRWRMSSPRMDHTATLLPDGRVALVGGWSSAGHTVASVDLFDPHRLRGGENPFTAAPNLPVPRHEHAAITIGSALLVTGGLRWDETTHTTLSAADILRFVPPPSPRWRDLIWD